MQALRAQVRSDARSHVFRYAYGENEIYEMPQMLQAVLAEKADQQGLKQEEKARQIVFRAFLLLFQLYNRHTQISLAVRTVTVGGYARIVMQVVLQGGAQNARSLSVDDAHGFDAREDRIIEIFVNDCPGFLGVLAADLIMAIVSYGLLSAIGL